jgi:hypothetical protein
MSQVISKDGTIITYEQSGQGPPVILISGASTSRVANAALAERLSPHFTVYNTALQTHTHQWLGTFSGASGAGNSEYRGELRQAIKAISTYIHAQSVPPNQAVVRKVD